MDGSPPLARRALLPQESGCDHVRFTSARAESTPSSARPSGTKPVHLRSRGENPGVAGDDSMAAGSPPLARRARGAHQDAAPRVRFTSARAESTTWSAPPQPPPPVHLRSRGEHQTFGTLRASQDGSPPLARRARWTGRTSAGAGRFTSARAESTKAAAGTAGAKKVHLRSRGEHGVALAMGQASHGSPPLARRAPEDVAEEAAELRFTSARAESTRRHRRPGPRGPVHLRSRGEHDPPPHRVHRACGSPPLARRARPDEAAAPDAARFTSARAESTRRGRRRRTCRAVHLRSRGEHDDEHRDADEHPGSPPLARRARGDQLPGARGGRFTSARAEST